MEEAQNQAAPGAQAQQPGDEEQRPMMESAREG